MDVVYSDRTLCSCLSLDAAEHKTYGPRKLSEMTPGFIFHVLLLSSQVTTTQSSLHLLSSNSVGDRSNYLFVILTYHSSQIQIMPMDSEVPSSLPWLSTQPCV